MHSVSDIMREHYTQTFEQYGSIARGVDWGAEADVSLRYKNMLDVLTVDTAADQPPSLLDVGCGYGGLYQFAKTSGIPLRYTGVDLCDNMLAFAKQEFPDASFYQGDFLNLPFDQPYDYVVCNGILTQKLTVNTEDMTAFANQLIQRMFKLSRDGVAFNVMTSHVNYKVDNLYYRDPVELLGYCLTKVTRYVKLNHAYPLYEYTMYLYHDPK